ncbi:MAG TPA: group II intron reverse transcriptase/maturase, partial [Xanthobacteraceae bacterium]|nr:group II intron reverse transcriptase/maturase [Xanthobacteraceae bacterium]
MMHDPEKSDLSIVASKPANAAAPAGAESVERRGRAKENASQYGMCRTPSRESMSSGLERVRTTAKLRKKERFTALLHHVTIELLRDAY